MTQRIADNYGNSFTRNGVAKTAHQNLHSSSTMPSLTTRANEDESDEEAGNPMPIM